VAHGADRRCLFGCEVEEALSITISEAGGVRTEESASDRYLLSRAQGLRPRQERLIIACETLGPKLHLCKTAACLRLADATRPQRGVDA
jgi:hypothetical protein